METKKSKYDTNPLDPDYVKEADESFDEGQSGSRTQEVKGATREIDSANDSVRSNVYSEAPTRLIADPPLEAPYPSVFVPPTYVPPPVAYKPPPHQALGTPPTYSQVPTSRSVPGIGLPEKWAVVLPYAPFYIGVVVSLLELFLVPRQEVKTRFHAAQGLAVHIAILAIHTLFSIIGAITGSSFGGSLFSLAAVIFLVISMIRVSKGEAHQIPPLADAAQWFNQKIDPRKQK